MDKCGVDVGVLSCGLANKDGVERMVALADAHPSRFYVAPTVDRATKPVRMCRRLREVAQHKRVRLVRVSPLVEQYPLNDRLYYPVYATASELGLPVSINVGIPGPPVRSTCQDPALLEDVLIDFPELRVIGAHMGHPYEALLIQYMLKWPNLYLSNSAYLATYMDPALVRFMDSRRGRGRVLFATDWPWLPMDRALEAARKLPLSEEAMDLFLGGAAARVLKLESA
jgi:predicted TIM-barrel fold metal-dependent hydrolase